MTSPRPDRLDRLQPPSERRIAVRVTPDAMRRIRSGHPWVFDRSIVSTSHDGAPGDLAVIFDDKRRFAAIGLWDPTSIIRIRVLHAGSPTTVDAAFWADALAASTRARDQLVADEATTGYRLVNGEGDRLPGLVIDRYADTAVVKIYSEAWLPHLPTLVPAVLDSSVTGGGIERVVLRLARSVVAAGVAAGLEDGVVVAGADGEPTVAFLEHGLGFSADVLVGHKTGHFLDQRDNRHRVGALSRGARVLDVFACTGGFSVHAAAGGATAVTSVDVSGPALEAARANMAANVSSGLVDERFSGAAHQTIAADAFAVLDDLRRRRERFDVVIVDPPSFTSRADTVPRARHAYANLTRAGLAVTEPGGVFVQSSCSARIGADELHELVLRTAHEAGVPVAVIERTGHAIDHPVLHPEGWYLKTTFLRVGR